MLQYIANNCSNNDDEEENQSKWFLTGAYMFGNTDRICDLVTSNNNTANGYAFDDDDKEAGSYVLINLRLPHMHWSHPYLHTYLPAESAIILTSI